VGYRQNCFGDAATYLLEQVSVPLVKKAAHDALATIDVQRRLCK
jgi:hypothetical protein